MSLSCENVNFEDLKPAGSAEEYALHVAALEWSLAEPIVIASKEDIKSRANWADGFEPYHHQVQNLIQFCRRLPVTLLADDVGLGKTISAGLILGELMERKRVSRALVICPSILGPQWEEELGSKFGIPAIFRKGKDLTDAIERSVVPVVVTTYDSARNRIASIRSDQFDMLILDEAHKLRNLHGTEHPPIMAQRVKKALEQRVFKYVMMLTATPIQNRLWDLYSLIDLLTTAKANRNPLGTPGEFRARFIADAAGRRLNPLTAETFRTTIRQYMKRTTRAETRLSFPERQVRTRSLAASEVERRLRELVAGEIAELNPLLQVSLGQAMMSSPQAVAKQLENMAARGSVAQATADAARRLADQHPITTKLKGLLKLVRELRTGRPNDWRLVVFTLRQETQQAIGRVLVEEGIAVDFVRGGGARANQAAIESFRQDPPRVNVIVSTDAGAEGVNLQAANVLVNYDLPWNPMVMEQRIGRIQRLASKHECVAIINLVIAGSVEEHVVGRLMEKLQVISQTIGDIEAILEAVGQDDDEDNFEEMVRKLVVKSLQGHDVEEATKKRKESIDAARKLMEEERENIRKVLGPSNEAAPAGPIPPKFQPVKPSIAAEQFVMRALSAEGAKLHPRGDDTIEVIRPGKPVERITFKPEVAESEGPGVFMGNKPQLYLPGRPAFERLVQRWLQRSGHCIRDLTDNSEAYALLATKAWCDGIPGAEFESVTPAGRRRSFTGEVICRVKSANGVDSLEKLMRIGPKAGPDDPADGIETSHAPILPEAMSADRAFDGIEPFVASSAVEDSDISEFCRFYLARRSEEMGRTGDDAQCKHKIDVDFSPKVFADVVGMSGARFDVVCASVAFVLDKEHRYEAKLELLPASNKILVEPDRQACVLTQRMLPLACLSACSISGRLATTHLMARSAESGRIALPQYCVRCDLTGDTLFNDEVSTSDVSGRTARTALFAKSPISGRKGLEDEFADCELTGTRVLSDELIYSDVSAKRFRRDESTTSAVSEKMGHKSEFISCQETGDVILPEEAGVSAMSGARVRRDKLLASQKHPHRLGTSSETAICALTGMTLLRDEVVASAVSGKDVDKELAAYSESSGRPALPQEAVWCEATGKVLLPDETEVSAVSGKRVDRRLLVSSQVSERKALREECKYCEMTGAAVLPDELVRSDESGLLFRKDQAVTSSESGRIGHQSEAVTCTARGSPILKGESAQSALSGKTYCRSLLSASEKPPHRLGIANEIATCAKSGARLLADEVVKSAVSEKMFDRELVRTSDCSGFPALPEEMVACQETGKHLLPNEADVCAVSGKLVDKRLLTASELSGKCASARLLEPCAVTGKLALPSELHACDLTGKRVCPSELDTCAVSHKRAIRYQFVRSDISGVSMLPEYAVWSPVSKRCCTPQEAVTCTWRGVLVPRDESAACRLTGLIFSRDLLNAGNEFLLLRALLDGKEAGTDAADLVGWLGKTLDHAVAGLKAARCVFSPDGAVRAVCGELRMMLGLKIRYAGLLVSDKDSRQVLGRVVVGKRLHSVWEADR